MWFPVLQSAPQLFPTEDLLPLDPTQDLIFPPELMVGRGPAPLNRPPTPLDAPCTFHWTH